MFGYASSGGAGSGSMEDGVPGMTRADSKLSKLKPKLLRGLSVVNLLLPSNKQNARHLQVPASDSHSNQLLRSDSGQRAPRKGEERGNVGTIMREDDSPRSPASSTRTHSRGASKGGASRGDAWDPSAWEFDGETSPKRHGKQTATAPDTHAYDALPQSHPSRHANGYEPLAYHDSADSDDFTHFRLSEAPAYVPSRGEELLQSIWFQGIMGALIVCNAVVIGFETEYKDLHCWDIVENLFLVVFAVELGLKLAIQGPREYFNSENPDIVWNSFDFFIVSLGIVDVTVDLLCEGVSEGNYATIFRIIRLMRILRIFRIVKFLKQLYMLAFGFALAAIAVFWVTFLMIFVLYVCAIILVRTVGHVGPEDPHYEFLHAKFGTIVHAMLTLFEIMSSPNLADYEEVMVERPFFCCFIVAFIIFGSFGMIALLTGVISESMFEKNNIRMEEERMDRESTRKLLIRTCEEWFDEVCEGDAHHSRSAPREDVGMLMPRIADLFEQEGVEYAGEDLEEMLDVIDCNGSGDIDRSEFRHFIVQMAEGVRPLLIMELYYAVGMVLRRSERIKAKMTTALAKVRHSEIATASRVHGGDPVTQALASLSAQVGDLADAVGKLDARMMHVDERVVQVTGRLDQVSHDLASARSAAATLGSDDNSPRFEQGGQQSSRSPARQRRR